jgi:hypothetical protein
MIDRYARFMRAGLPLFSCIAALLAATAGATAQTPPGRQGLERLARIQEQEGEAVVALADAAMTGKDVPSDFALEWHNDFLKAQQGTFVPFVVSLEAARLTTSAVLLYLRAAPRRPVADPSRAVYPFEDVYPVEVRDLTAERVRVTRGFAIAPGAYDLILVARERVDPGDPSRPRKAAVRRLPLLVPDFWGSGLTTSTIMLADRQVELETPVRNDELAERPYAIGLSEIQPSVDRRFGRGRELIVVFLVYNAAVTQERKFDLEVEYHFFQDGTRPGDGEEAAAHWAQSLARPGERYFNHTKPQRFTPAIMGPQFDPSSGQPVMAGQGVPLSGFPEGKYRLAIRITDIIAGKSIMRDVTFAVTPQ